MKKLFLSLVAAIVAATATYAQSDLVATLSHDGVTTAYYGANALKDAHTAAAHGDVITLSSGQFNAVTINKAVTIRGAGMKANTETKTLPTTITGDFEIGSLGSSGYQLSIEGVYINDVVTIASLKEASFQKCRFAKISFRNTDYRWDNLSFVNCLITTCLLFKEGTVSCRNCYVKNAFCVRSSSNFEFTNCIVVNDGNTVTTYSESGSYSNSSAWLSNIKSSSFYNCIIYGASDASEYNILAGSCTASHCIGRQKLTGNNTNVFGNIPATDNTDISDEGKDLIHIFEDYTGTYTDDVTFTLTDDAKSKYKGIDGTQVGIYGGDVPFDPTPSNPQITRFDVEKSTANGKLTVKINVE